MLLMGAAFLPINSAFFCPKNKATLTLTNTSVPFHTTIFHLIYRLWHFLYSLKDSLVSVS